MAKIDLSIIIVSFNTQKVTKDCLYSIFQSLGERPDFHSEIIVVDNASTDGSAELITEIQKTHVNVTLLQNKKNLGFAKANNLGAEAAKGTFLLFLNSDIVVQNQAIEKLFAFFKANAEKMQFIGGKLLNRNHSPQPSCGPFYSLPVVFAALFLRGDYWGLTRSSPQSVRRVDWVSGACIMTKKDYFENLDGFDENIFMYMDEIDLLFRASKKGMKTGFYPQAQFIHLGSASSSGRSYPILQVFKGFLYFYRKHYGRRSMFLLKIMLQLKAVIGLIIGYILNNQYLKETYGKAFAMVAMD